MEKEEVTVYNLVLYHSLVLSVFISVLNHNVNKIGVSPSLTQASIASFLVDR